MVMTAIWLVSIARS